MILINLLPHREEKRRLRKQAFFIGLGLSAVAGLVLVVLWYALQQQMIGSQQARNDFLQNEIVKLDDQIKDVAMLKAEIESLKARQKAVEDLQLDRNMPVHLLNELVRQTPEGIFLKQIKLETVRQAAGPAKGKSSKGKGKDKGKVVQPEQVRGDAVTITGIAQTNERVSAFLRNTAYNSPWLERPELQEIKAASVTLADAKDPKRLFEFSMKVWLKRPQPVVDDAASGVAPAASGPKGSKTDLRAE